jgi:ATP-dependent Clp protease ATP-binding subunit ClpA
MPQALSQNLELALTYARQEAIGLESKSIQAEHLLLGLSRIAGDPAAEFLRENGLTLPFVMLAVERVLQRQTAPRFFASSCAFRAGA